MSAIPFVYPNNNDVGISLQPNISAIFDAELDYGSITTSSCVLVKKSSEYSNNSISPIPVMILGSRIQLTSDEKFTAPNYGDDPNQRLCRTLIAISPTVYLDPNSEYSVILGSEIGTISVFDPKPLNGGVSKIIAKGPYEAPIEDEFILEILDNGEAGLASFKYTRMSDSKTATVRSRTRFIELEEGLFVCFQGTLIAGEKFSIKVKPIQRMNEIFAWNFTTGDRTFKAPEDERSNVLLDLPIKTDSPNSVNKLALINVIPYDGQTMVTLDKAGVVEFVFNKSIDPTSVTADTVKVFAESVITAKTYNQLDVQHEVVDNKIRIKIK